MNYALALTSLLLMDAAWIWGIAYPRYIQKLGPLMGDQVRWWAVVLFYLVYAGAITGLTLDDDPAVAAKRGALLGAASYGAWNFTNAAILRDWPSEITVMDLGWGTLMTASTSALVSYVQRSMLSLPGA